MKLKDVLAREIKRELERHNVDKHSAWRQFNLVLKSGLVVKGNIEVIPGPGDDFLIVRAATVENPVNQKRGELIYEYYSGDHFTRISEISSFCLSKR